MDSPDRANIMKMSSADDPGGIVFTRVRWWFILTVAIVVLATPLSAQSGDEFALTQSYRSPRGTIAFQYPEGWNLRFDYLNEGWLFNASVNNYADPNSGFSADPDEVSIGITLTRADSRFGYSRQTHSTPRDVIETALRYPDYNDTTPDEIREYTINGRPAASALYEDIAGRTYGIAIEAYPGEGGATLIWTIGVNSAARGFDPERWIPLADAIAATLTYTPPDQLPPLAELTLVESDQPVPALEAQTVAAVTVGVPEGWAFSANDDERDDIVSYTGLMSNMGLNLPDFLQQSFPEDGVYIALTAREAWEMNAIGLDAPTLLERSMIRMPLGGQNGPMQQRQVNAYQAAVLDIFGADMGEMPFDVRMYVWIVPRGEPREHVTVSVIAFVAPGGLDTYGPLIDQIAQSLTIAGADEL
jgi:hypothetical protein